MKIMYVTMTKEKHEKKADNWKKQQRCPITGHWLSYDGTKPKKVTLKDVRAAYIAGLNDHGGTMLPSKKAELYIKKMGLLG